MASNNMSLAWAAGPPGSSRGACQIAFAPDVRIAHFVFVPYRSKMRSKMRKMLLILVFHHPVFSSSCLRIIRFSHYPVLSSSWFAILLLSQHSVFTSSWFIIYLVSHHPVFSLSCSAVVLFCYHPAFSSSCFLSILFSHLAVFPTSPGRQEDDEA